MANSSSAPNPATSLNLLILGAGVCGPTLALLLQRSNPNHKITLVERYATLRTGGQQIDLKAQCIPIRRHLGLLEELRKHCVNESCMELVDSRGQSLIPFGVTKTGASAKASELTNEFELMRGDFVELMYTTSLNERKALDTQGGNEGSLSYIFNTTFTALTQTTSTSTTATFSSGDTGTSNLIIAADGQGSRTRRLAFGEPISKQAFKSLNIHAAYYNIPRLPHENSLARIYFAPRNRMVMTRTGDRPVTQVHLFLLKDAQKQRMVKMREVQKRPLQEQKDAWKDIYADAGWECARFTRGIDDVGDLYATEIAQVKMPAGQLYAGRTVLLGDAGYFPSAFTGMGTTLSLVGAYVLAGELAKYPDDVNAALKAYETMMEQPVKECQQLAGWIRDGSGFYPQSGDLDAIGVED
ncbi:FAD/NAD(P)-binding domain-containing protein [Stemphylium lycopersici]|nr:FAD/NAD(P)-binding domain-containing protein [Stemphylium lycopersici]